MLRPSFQRFPESMVGRRLVDGVLRYFDATLVGHERVPREGGALLVANHGVFGFDAFILGALLWQHTRRLAVWLADRNLWKTPGLAATLDWVNAIPGTPDDAVGHLRAGEIVIVYPGGIFDSYKHQRDRHKLKWRNRAGFARVALRAGAPIVPIAACGVDDMYRIVGRDPFLGRILFGDRRYNLPIALGRYGTLVPRPAKVTVHALAPIFPAGDADNPSDVERVRAEVHDSIQAKLDET
ncbi:MAG TPA: lysophospholipid acyltransferase family protein [Polyangiaceae bacterium]|jgi:1-acyl-sn-glycerol-3-phosphate acyltransferase